MAIHPARGEVWTVNLNPIMGHEQAGQRPALVVSNDTFNRGPADLVMVIPLTSKGHPNALHIPLIPPEGGLSAPSMILCEQMRTVSKERFKGSAWGRVSVATMREVDDRLRILLDL